MKSIIRFVKDESGTTITEYAVLSGLISLAAMSAMVALGVKFLTMISA